METWLKVFLGRKLKMAAKAKYANHRFEGKLVYGLENWKHDPNNDKSYLVTIRSGGKDHEI